MAKTPRRQSRYPHALEHIDQTLAERADPLQWIEANLWIRTKSKVVVPLQLNPVQQDYCRKRTSRDIILKARQLGCTTVSCALIFADTVLQPNVFSVIVAHDLESCALIFQIVRLFQERLPAEERRQIGEPRILNRREMYWPSLNSRFFVATAGSRTFGRGQTINNVLCSEFPRWPDPEEALTSLTEAVPEEGRIIIESTANGMGNFFHDLWIEAKEGANSYTPHFHPWWWDPQYRVEGPPLEDLTEEESELQNRHGLTEGQLRWRRTKQRELRHRFPQEYPEDDVTCFLASGRCCFDATALMAAQKRIAGEPEPKLVPHLQDGKGNRLPVAPARLLVWREPEKGREYVIGADVGEGLAHSDPSVACVLDRESGNQVGELHGRVPPDRFARLLDALGRYYNRALLGVERNNHGHSALNTLLNTCQYPDLYYHKDYDQSGQQRRRPGWPTDQKTKPIMIDDLAAAIAEGALFIHSSGLVDECFTFVTTDTGGQEAQPGKHDDRVIAAAIAWQVRKQPETQFFIARASAPVDEPARDRQASAGREVKGRRFSLPYPNGPGWPEQLRLARAGKLREVQALHWPRGRIPG